MHHRNGKNKTKRRRRWIRLICGSPSKLLEAEFYSGGPWFGSRPVHRLSWLKPSSEILKESTASSFRSFRHERYICHVSLRFIWQALPTVNRKHLFMNIFLLSSFAHKNLATERFYSVVHSSSMVTILTTEPVSEHAHARLLPAMSWSWTVLLPSDKTKLRGFILQANYTDRATAACRRS
jgi:hypothetical protein